MRYEPRKHSYKKKVNHFYTEKLKKLIIRYIQRGEVIRKDNNIIFVQF